MCWDIRLLARDAQSVAEVASEGVSIRRYRPRERKVKMRPVRTISREVFVTPQRLYAGHPNGMMRQSELPSDRKLSDQRLALHT